jgi:hypothetical protein
LSDINEPIEGGQPLNPNLKKKLNEARQQLDSVETMPDGYIEVKLSTKGLIGAPATFRIRNFSPEDLMNLGLADQEELPIRLIKVLDDLIYNPSNSEVKISVKNFHEKEVTELLLLLYETFYTTIFPNQQWVLTDEDKEFLKAECGGETDEYFLKLRAIENKSWKPTFDIDISKDLSYWEIDPNIKTRVQISRKYGDKTFTSTFSLPKFGDFITLKYFIDQVYKEQDRRFASIAETYKFRKSMEEKLQNGENIDIRRIPQVPKEELDKFKQYETEKSLFAITASKALYLCEFDGHDVISMPLEKKLELAKDPRLDYSTFKMVQDHFNKLEFGLKEEITVVDPIINKVVTQKYSFQLTDLLEAIRDTGTSETTISFV